jgi:hypothetical protein
METTMVAIVVAAQGYGITDRTKTYVRASPKATARAFRTMAHDFASRRCGSRASTQTRGSQLATTMSQMADRVPPVCASLVKRDGDNSFTLIWSRRNSDRSNRIDVPHLFGSRVNGADHNTPFPTGFKPKSV